ncbi:glycogen synthase [candidate division CSSED10-310 bacterium]|uniref:Glycogen synthase n=1 Tax=candidate division CSSED10-310 bacterium TaxID=2855610 RepID=A0ABV6YQX6_UNCC1
MPEPGIAGTRSCRNPELPEPGAASPAKLVAPILLSVNRKNKGEHVTEPLKILFLAAEVDPFAKVGGLGDVAGSLPKALKSLGHDVRVVMPAYQKIEQGFPGVIPIDGMLRVLTGAGMIIAGGFQSVLPGSEVPIYFIAEQNLFDRSHIYGYGDDAYRFSFFSRAALELTLALDWQPDIVHAHDWHTAPAIMWLATAPKKDKRLQNLATIFTIHNLAHQGRSSWDIIEYLNVGQTYSLNEEGYGEINFMARGIHHATMINTVSPNYSREILTPEHGVSLEGLLLHRSFDIHGILNGLDYEAWNPASDPRLVSNFDVDHLSARVNNKRALQKYLQLPQRDDVPLIVMVTRLDYQKGLDIVGHPLHLLLSNRIGEAQFAVLGTGAPEYERMFANLANTHKMKMTAVLDYQTDLAPLFYAGSDIFLMPSRFEPCGLGQLIAMRYGSVPIVRATGGLADTVLDGYNGFSFNQLRWEALWYTLYRAIYLYYTDPSTWRLIQNTCMSTDSSWSRSARSYQQLYRWAIARHLL